MITKVVLDSSGVDREIDWSWQHESGDWWVEIEFVDGETPNLSDEQQAAAQEACADAYPLSQYQEESAIDADYYDR